MNLDTQRSSRIRSTLLVGAVALGLLALIMALAIFRGGRDGSPASDSSASPSSSAAAVVSGGPSASAPATASNPQPSSTAATATTGASTVKPDAKHGMITPNKIRTESDATNLQDPPQFAAGGSGSFQVAVSPDGKRVAIVRIGETGSQLMTFTTARPSDVTIVTNPTSAGEISGEILWAGDNSDSVLIKVEKIASGAADASAEYSTLRSVDLVTKQVKEIVRVTTGVHLVPLAWLPARNIAAAAEVIGGGSVPSYDLVRNGTLERTPISGAHITQLDATRDGSRVLAIVNTTSIRWWPLDQPSSVTTISATGGDTIGRAEFRPGAEELGVQVTSAGVHIGPDSGRFEIWSLNGQSKRKVTDLSGFGLWRADGSAAFALDNNRLIDPATGAISDIPSGQFIYATVLF